MYYQYELTHFEGDMGHGVASDEDVHVRVPPYVFPETCAHAGCRCGIPKWRTCIIPLGVDRRAPLRHCRARYVLAVDTAPLCCVVGATAPP